MELPKEYLLVQFIKKFIFAEWTTLGGGVVCGLGCSTPEPDDVIVSFSYN